MDNVPTSEAWMRQFIRSLYPYSASRMNIEKAFLIKHPHVPAKLYKYRQFSDNHLDALRRGVLWMSTPDRFNDPYDASVFFNPERFWIEDYTIPEFLRVTAEINRVVKAGGHWTPSTLKKPIRSGDWRQKIAAELLKSVAASAKADLLSFINGFFKKLAEDSIRRMSDGFRSGFSVLSLSERRF